MKAQELRINNLVQDQEGNLLKVIELTSMLSDRNTVGYYVVDRRKYPLAKGWKAEPIPLKEEWLLKLGFEEFAVEDLYHFKKMIGMSYPTNESYIHIEGNLDDVITDKTGRECWKVDKTRNSENEVFLSGIQYVHQLQNLYFALTEKELTIKENETINTK